MPLVAGCVVPGYALDFIRNRPKYQVFFAPPVLPFSWAMTVCRASSRPRRVAASSRAWLASLRAASRSAWVAVEFGLAVRSAAAALRCSWCASRSASALACTFQLAPHLVKLPGRRLGGLLLLGQRRPRLVGHVLVGSLQVGAQLAGPALDLRCPAVRGRQVGPQGLRLVGARGGLLLGFVALRSGLAGLLVGVIQFRAQLAGSGLGRGRPLAGRCQLLA